RLAPVRDLPRQGGRRRRLVQRLGKDALRVAADDTDSHLCSRVPSTVHVFGIAGYKNAGKTTLVVALVSELTSRGWRVGTVKHAHHDFDIDHPGKDSFLHRQAGASEVIVSSARRRAHI